MLRLLRVRELHEDLELLLLSEILNLDFGSGGLLSRRSACGMLGEQRLHTPLHYSDFHFILGLCLDVKFECVRCRLAVQDPQEEVHIAVVKFAVNRIRVCLGSQGQPASVKLGWGRKDANLMLRNTLGTALHEA